MINGLGKGGVNNNSCLPTKGGGGGYGGNGGKSGHSQSVEGKASGNAYDFYSLSQGQNGADGVTGGDAYDIGLGGYGGAKIMLNCSCMTLFGIISANGANGKDGGATMAGQVDGGGGGSGGGIGIIARSILHKGLIYCNGGKGGDGTGMGAGGNGGGGGSGGRVLIEYKNAVIVTNNILATNGQGGTGFGIGANGLKGDHGTKVYNIIPDPPELITPLSNAESMNPPVFKFKAADPDTSTLYYKLEFSANNFATFDTFDQYSNPSGWSKASYASGEEAQFIYPNNLDEGKIYYFKAYAFDGSVYSDPTSIIPFKCGKASKYDVESGKAVEKHNVLSLNNDGINDYIELTIRGNTSGDSIEIKIYNLRGDLVRQLPLNQTQWDGKDNMGKPVESGTYMFQVKIGDKISTGLVTVVK
ncbi:MAG: gliding motility-associated C-terminal domain-containing protein [bacterium]|nr:gliding motility-associated C-terminal domain-containing protein [bacterium]